MFFHYLCIMKKTLTILFIFLVSFTYSQTYTRCDSVDSIAMNYLNMYRAHYKLCKLTTDTITFKSNCVDWTKDAITHITILKHTHKGFAEVCFGGPSIFENLRKPSNFTIFVKNTINKEISELTDIDIVIMTSLYSWENSPKHKEILTDKTNTKAYFSMTYYVKSYTKSKDIFYSVNSIIELK